MDYVNEERLLQRLDAARVAYRTAEPFPHIELDGLLKEDVAGALEAQFPRPDHRLWKHHLHLNAHKFACNRLEAMPALFQAVLGELNSTPMIEYLEALTGIPDLVADGELEGGGLHQIVRGGYLKIHADFNCHPSTGFHRRLNLLLYLNREWDEAWNGNLELWDRSMSRCVKSVTPILNRCVVFSTTDFAYHGHPRPLKCPATTSRRSLALYYYTAVRPHEETGRPHSTLYQRTPSDSLVGQALGLTAHLLASPQALRALLRKLRHCGRLGRQSSARR